MGADYRAYIVDKHIFCAVLLFQLALQILGVLHTIAVADENGVICAGNAGIDHGMSFRLRNEGGVGSNGGPNGDVLVEIYIRRHAIFERDGMDVLCEVPITFTQAALGGEIEVPTLDGKVKYDLPEGTQTGRDFVLPGKGIPQVNNPKRRGNHRFFVTVETPTKLTKEQRELLQKLEESFDGKATPKRKKFFDTLKDLFD